MPSAELTPSSADPARPRVRRLGLFLATASASLLLFGAMSRAWWSGDEPGSRFAVGLRGVEMCRGDSCAVGALSSLGGPADTWEHIGIAAFAAGVVAALFLLVTVGAALRESRLRFVSRVAASVSFFAAGVATAFVLLSPELEGLRPSYGMAAYYLGAALGAGSAGALLAPSAQ